MTAKLSYIRIPSKIDFILHDVGTLLLDTLPTMEGKNNLTALSFEFRNKFYRLLLLIFGTCKSDLFLFHIKF